MNSLDLSGKILFKVRLDNEIKKLMIHNDDLNYNDLILMLQRIFSDKIRQHDEFTIKYTDEENDLITISDDSDVSLALQTSKILKLTIFMKGSDETRGDLRPNEIVNELRRIRESIDKFLDSLEKTVKIESKVEDIVKNTDEIKLVQSVNPEVQKEFDPLNRKLDTSAISLQKHSRAQTPDSICSNEMSGRFSPRQTQQYQQQQHHFQQPQHQVHQFQQNQQVQQTPQQWQPQQHQLPTQQQHQQPLGVQQQHQLPTQQQPQQQQAPQPQQHQQMPSHPGMGGPSSFIPNPALKNPSQLPYPTQTQPQFMPNQQLGMQPQSQQAPQPNQQPQQQQQPNAPIDPSQSYYQHNYQSNNYQQQNLQSPSQSSIGGMNPYSKNPNVSLVRPPSATIYQQGYK